MRKILPILAAIIHVLLLYSCKDARVAELEDIQTYIEEYPDSALKALESFDSSGITGHAGALYGLLITQARYKNFIDEDNDSLISASSDYFLTHGDYKNAGMSLFLTGIIQRNAARYGEAAVNFMKGLDISAQHGLYHTEGLCARGLFKLHVSVYDATQQIKYAKMSVEAFTREGDNDWANYALLDLATAYCNGGQYSDALHEASRLRDIARSVGDTVLLAESIQLIALSEFATGDDMSSIKNYILAYELDNSVFTDNDRSNLMVAINHVDRDSVPDSAVKILDESANAQADGVPFEILAREGKYKEAYESLDEYRIKQDQVISLLMKDNVAENLFSYQQNISLIQKEKAKRERAIWILSVIAVLFAGVFTVNTLRRRLRIERKRQENIIENAECLRTDLMRQLVTNAEISTLLKNMLRNDFSVFDKLCTAYYEGMSDNSEKKRIVSEVERIIKDFSKDSSSIGKLEEYADKHTGGLYSSLKTDMPGLKELDYHMYLYLLLGFSAQSISIFLGESVNVVYNRKSRLKSRIESSSSDRKEKYLAAFNK